MADDKPTPRRPALSREALEALGITNTAYLERMGVTIDKPAAAPDAPTPSAAAAPVDNPFGFWLGGGGSILHVARSRSSSWPIAVSGKAFDEEAEGSGTVDSHGIQIAIQLQATRRKFGLELQFSGENWIGGKATDDKGESKGVQFTRIAVDAEGAWQHPSGASSLTVGAPTCEPFEGEPRVQADVTGDIFRRGGRGRLTFFGDAASGLFEATDFAFYNQYLKDAFARDHLIEERDLRHRYRRDCPREGWWGNDVLFMALRFSRDGRVAFGTVRPSDVAEKIGDLMEEGHDLQKGIEEPIHLNWTVGGSTRVSS
jgi:hypothetical protein